MLCVSFHRYGDDFFPNSGESTDIGVGQGKYYSLNVPLKRFMDDDSYELIFSPIMTRVMQVYKPSMIVMQCGADS